ncbi:hypothetical protein CTEN210_01547 [Chaetoceros tenuissimus]|uniref:ParB-like N-terminal domain-containing protein n=1 Tax=Chaetoceros tenuissimus TaxID=426638 RepID=A0AAD3CG87_9STRA|nr:hypothetical protein CTEN210_01547 [Chaetoceros tenuissimus]
MTASAFSCTQISKSSFRYYSNDERCGMRFVASDSSLNLYKDTRNGMDGMDSSVSPVFSSIASESWASSVDYKGAASSAQSEAKSSSPATSPLGKLARGVSNIFGVVSDVLNRDTTKTRKPAPSILLEEDIEDEDDQVHLSQSQIISLVDINWLKEHEQVVSEERVQNLLQSTIEWDAYKMPLLVDSKSGAILDGHHRYAVGRAMGLSRLPAILVDYLNDETISVDVWPDCGLDCLSKEDVIEMSLSKDVFPPKTSKHDFVSSFTSIHVPLSKLL